jgi:hypothetical protein
MREDGVLVGIEGVYGNILKIRPPLVFSRVNADPLIAALDRALESTGSMRVSPRSRLCGCFSTHSLRNFADSVTRFL